MVHKVAVEVEVEVQVQDEFMVEVQLQVDRDKRFVWPAYVSAAHHKHRLPVTLLIITPSREVAQAARAPLSFDGHEPTLQPVVIGPDELPVLTRPEDAAKDLDLAALSALALGPQGGEPVAKMIRAFQERRNYVVERLRQIEGVKLAEPTGAFYVLPEMRNFFGPGAQAANFGAVPDSDTFCRWGGGWCWWGVGWGQVCQY